MISCLHLLRDAALLQAALDAEGYIWGKHVLECLDILAVDGISPLQAKDGADDRLLQAKESLSRLLHARVLRSKASNEDSIVAVGVELGVHRALWEDRHLVLIECVRDQGCAVLGEEVGSQATLDDDVDFAGARMDVRSVEAAWADEAHRH